MADEDIYWLDAPDIGTCLGEIVKENSQGVIIGGGDGTAVAAASVLVDRGIPFAVLPLGTMNLLAQDLGALSSFEETMDKINGFVPDIMDVGVLNGEPFLCSAVIGVVPEGAVLREELRNEITFDTMARFVSMMCRGLAGGEKKRLNLKVGDYDVGYSLDTTSLIVSNNAFTGNPQNPQERFSRPDLKAGKLAVYSAAPEDMLDGIRMAIGVLQGSWQEQENIKSFEIDELIVNTTEEEVLVSLDGEPKMMKPPLHFTIRRASLPVLRLELAA